MEKYGKLEVAYEKKDNDSLSNYISYVSVPFKNLIYGDLAFCSSCWQKNMSEKWYHWCMLSPAEWENCDHEKGDMWSIQSIKNNLEKTH